MRAVIVTLLVDGKIMDKEIVGSNEIYAQLTSETDFLRPNSLVISDCVNEETRVLGVFPREQLVHYIFEDLVDECMCEPEESIDVAPSLKYSIDGDYLCITHDSFVNLMESPAVFIPLNSTIGQKIINKTATVLEELREAGLLRELFEPRALRKLVAREFVIEENMARAYPKGFTYTELVDPETGEVYDPIVGWEVTGNNLRDLFKKRNFASKGIEPILLRTDRDWTLDCLSEKV